MVALSMYRGNLHKAPDIPRRWLMPTPIISLKDFKSLLHRRTKALSRIRSSSSSSKTDPHLNPNPDLQLKPQLQSPNPPAIEPKLEAPVEPAPPLDLETKPIPAVVNEEVVEGSDGGDCLNKQEFDEKHEKHESLQVDEKPPEEATANLEESEKANELSEKEKRKRDLEEKLQVMNAKKHKLVQVLKQILNVEEEAKRRNSMQGAVFRPAVPLQVESMNDSGSMTRLVTPRTGSEANLAGENEGGEADDVSNLNVHSRHVFRMSSMSPSSESPLRRSTYIQHCVVPHPSRPGIGVTGSPSRFAPTGNQGHYGNPPTVSVSGTNYMASSPSPAASGGTSVFREARQPSPWS